MGFDPKLLCKSCQQPCWSMTLGTEKNDGKPWDMCAGCRSERSRADRAEARVAELELRREWTATLPGGPCRIICENGGLAITAIPESDGEFVVRRVDDGEPSGEGES